MLAMFLIDEFFITPTITNVRMQNKPAKIRAFLALGIDIVILNPSLYKPFLCSINQTLY